MQIPVLTCTKDTERDTSNARGGLTEEALRNMHTGEHDKEVLQLRQESCPEEKGLYTLQIELSTHTQGP